MLSSPFYHSRYFVGVPPSRSIELLVQGLVRAVSRGGTECCRRGFGRHGAVCHPLWRELVPCWAGGLSVCAGGSQHGVEKAGNEPGVRATENRQHIRRIRQHQQGMYATATASDCNRPVQMYVALQLRMLRAALGCRCPFPPSSVIIFGDGTPRSRRRE